jgi:hypothetical protein
VTGITIIGRNVLDRRLDPRDRWVGAAAWLVEAAGQDPEAGPQPALSASAAIMG